jgi:hypothetical protein
VDAQCHQDLITEFVKFMGSSLFSVEFMAHNFEGISLLPRRWPEVRWPKTNSRNAAAAP